jgi:hypothetical protein
MSHHASLSQHKSRCSCVRGPIIDPPKADGSVRGITDDLVAAPPVERVGGASHDVFTTVRLFRPCLNVPSLFDLDGNGKTTYNC